MSRRGEKSYIVRARETVVREYVVDARNEAEAEADFHKSDDVTEREIVDWEVESVEENS